MKGTFKMALGVGGPSIIMIVVMLCLTTLASLTLITANRDWQLTKKTVEFSKAYYEADCKAEDWLAQVNTLDHLGKEPPSLTFKAEVSDRQSMIVTIQKGERGYQVVSQRLVPDEYWNYEEYQPQYDDALVK